MWSTHESVNVFYVFTGGFNVRKCFHPKNFHIVFNISYSIMKAAYPNGNYMFKVSNRNTRTRRYVCSKFKDTRTTSLLPLKLSFLMISRGIVVSFWCLYCWLWTHLTPFSCVSIVNFGQVNTSWLHILFIVKWLKNFTE